MNNIIAWGVHLLTSLGVVAGLLALLAVLSNQIEEAFLWLMLAFFIDGIDGPLARKFGVTEFTPDIQGDVLDNIVDYLNYVFVPVLIIYQFNMVPDQIKFFTAACILVVSCFTFANTKLKTEDNYFQGFPAVWNLAVFYLYIINTSEIVNSFILIGLSILTFVPIKYIHPFRVKEWRPFTLLVTLLWGISSLFLLLGNQLIYIDIIFWLWVISSFYFMFISIRQSKKDKFF